MHAGICLDNVETQAFDPTQAAKAFISHEESLEISDDEPEPAANQDLVEPSRPDSVPRVPKQPSKACEPKEPIPVPSPCRARVPQQPLEACQPKKPNPIPSPLPDSVPSVLEQPQKACEPKQPTPDPSPLPDSVPRVFKQPQEACKPKEPNPDPSPLADSVPRVPEQPQKACKSKEPNLVPSPLPDCEPKEPHPVPPPLADSEPRVPEQPEKAYEPKEPNPSLPMALSTDSAAKASAGAEHDNQKKAPELLIPVEATEHDMAAEEPSSSTGPGANLAKVRARVQELVEVEIADASRKHSTSELEHAKLRKYLLEARL